MMSNLHVESLKLGELDTNCYIAWCDSTRQAAIIDPADAGEAIAELVLSLQLEPIAILLTHAHFDHVLGTLATQLSFDIPVYLHQADDALLATAQKSAEHWLKHRVDPVPPATHQLHSGQVLTVGDCELQVLHTPGHTPGSCSFYWQPKNHSANAEHFRFSEVPLLFAGDVIFVEGIGRTDHRYSSKRDLFQSLKTIRDLGDCCVYPGHGEAFMRADQPLLQRSS